MRINQQTERNKHHYLEQPRVAVEKSGKALLINYLVIANYKTCYIHRQIAVSVQQVSERKYEIHNSQQQHRIQRFVVKINMVQQIHCTTPQQITSYSSHRHLHDKCRHGSPYIHCATFYDSLHKDYGKYISHRVVTAAFQFQQRSEVLFESLPFGAQYRKHRCRVGRRHDRSKQK